MFAVNRYQPERARQPAAPRLVLAARTTRADPSNDSSTPPKTGEDEKKQESGNEQQQDETITVLSQRQARKLKRHQDRSSTHDSIAIDDEQQRRERREAKRVKREARRQHDDQPTEDTEERKERETGAQPVQQPQQSVSLVDLRALLALKNSTKARQDKPNSHTAATPTAVVIKQTQAGAVIAPADESSKGQKKKDPAVRAAERAARKRARELKERRERGEVIDEDEEAKAMHLDDNITTPQQAASTSTADQPEDSEQTQQALTAEEELLREQKRLAARPNWMMRGNHIDPSSSCPTHSIPLHPALLSALQRHGITDFFPVQATVLPFLLSPSASDVAVSSPTGSGKCFARGTRLRMYNGDSIAVESIRGGEQLMGDDGLPRTVQSGSLTHYDPRQRAEGQPEEKLYRISPTWDGARPFTVNGAHILVLVNNQTPFSKQQSGQPTWRAMWWEVSTDGRMVCRSTSFPTKAQAQARVDSLKATWQPVEWEVSVDDYLRASNAAKYACKLIACKAITFVNPQLQQLRLSVVLHRLLGVAPSGHQVKYMAWWLGMWLTDGDSGQARISQGGAPPPDPHHHHQLFARLHDYQRVFNEPVEKVFDQTSSAGWPVYWFKYGMGSVAGRVLQVYGLVGNKHIPRALICDLIGVRRFLLAGIIDGNGYYDPGNVYEIAAKHRHVIVGYKELAATLGLRNGDINPHLITNQQTGVQYMGYRINLSGDMWDVVQYCAATYKQCPQPGTPGYVEKNKDSRCYGFTIAQDVNDPTGEYFGFAVTGGINRRFLLEDYTVAHNVRRHRHNHTLIQHNLHTLSLPIGRQLSAIASIDILVHVVVSCCVRLAQTLVYLLPILHQLTEFRVRRLRALVLVPSRDLAMQVAAEAREYGKGVGVKVGVSLGGGGWKREQAELVRRKDSRWSDLIDYSSFAPLTSLDTDLFPSSTSAPSTPTTDEYESLVDVLVTTPGRLIDHLNGTRGFTLAHLQWLVIDEVDRLLTQNYNDWAKRIQLALTPATPASALLYSDPAARCQKLLFSATLTGDPSSLASLHLKRPVLFIDSQSRQKRYTMPEGLRGSFYLCEAAEKPLLLLYVLSRITLVGDGKAGSGSGARDRGEQVLVFTSSIESCHRVARLLQLWGYNASAEYSSSFTQHQRTQLLSAFRARHLSILVSSDLMSRGLDITGITTVINYDPPLHIQTHVHRAGRTARAGQSGSVVTLCKRREYSWFIAVVRRAANSMMDRETADKQWMQGQQERYGKVMERLREVVEEEQRGRLDRLTKLSKAWSDKPEDKELQQLEVKVKRKGARVEPSSEKDTSKAGGKPNGVGKKQHTAAAGVVTINEDDSVDESEWSFELSTKR